MTRKAVAIIGLIATIALFAQSKPRSAKDGVFTADQARRGAEAWSSKCAECHGAEMQGGPAAPGMVGDEFLFNWGGKPASELYNYLHMNMPPDAPGSLADQRYADILAAILQKNGFPAGQAELPADSKVLTSIEIPKEK